MYNHLSTYSTARPKEARLLSISHSEYLGKLLGFSGDQITDISYPKFNILNLPFQNEEFDAVVSDQVLEHIEGNPQVAIDETFRVLKNNGLALHTSCLIKPVHPEPKDFWRFTPEGLSLLVDNYGEIIDVGGWGNPYVWLYIAFGLLHEPIPHARWHPAHWLATRNVSSWPVVTWILVRKTSV
jgi:SAM-dependent methyltransferase